MIKMMSEENEEKVDRSIENDQNSFPLTTTILLLNPLPFSPLLF